MNIVITIVCACTFMVVKYVEYSHKIHDGLLWGPNFDPHEQVYETESFKHKHPAAAAYAEKIAAGMGLAKHGEPAGHAEVANAEGTATHKAHRSRRRTGDSGLEARRDREARHPDSGRGRTAGEGRRDRLEVGTRQAAVRATRTSSSASISS